jgi:hypothetical protein
LACDVTRAANSLFADHSCQLPESVTPTPIDGATTEALDISEQKALNVLKSFSEFYCLDVNAFFYLLPIGK